MFSASPHLVAPARARRAERLYHGIAVILHALEGLCPHLRHTRTRVVLFNNLFCKLSVHQRANVCVCVLCGGVLVCGLSQRAIEIRIAPNHAPLGRAQ